VTTPTLASRIRALAVRWNYWSQDAAEQKLLRADIVRELGCSSDVVRNTLLRVGTIGRPRTRKHCATCTCLEHAS